MFPFVIRIYSRLIMCTKIVDGMQSLTTKIKETLGKSVALFVAGYANWADRHVRSCGFCSKFGGCNDWKSFKCLGDRELNWGSNLGTGSGLPCRPYLHFMSSTRWPTVRTINDRVTTAPSRCRYDAS